MEQLKAYLYFSLRFEMFILKHNTHITCLSNSNNVAIWRGGVHSQFMHKFNKKMYEQTISRNHVIFSYTNHQFTLSLSQSPSYSSSSEFVTVTLSYHYYTTIHDVTTIFIIIVNKETVCDVQPVKIRPFPFICCELKVKQQRVVSTLNVLFYNAYKWCFMKLNMKNKTQTRICTYY